MLRGLCSAAATPALNRWPPAVVQLAQPRCASFRRDAPARCRQAWPPRTPCVWRSAGGFAP
eukprot:3496526-Alexandrium_andersonii.AAC.1